MKRCSESWLCLNNARMGSRSFERCPFAPRLRAEFVTYIIYINIMSSGNDYYLCRGVEVDFNFYNGASRVEHSNTL